MTDGLLVLPSYDCLSLFAVCCAPLCTIAVHFRQWTESDPDRRIVASGRIDRSVRAVASSKPTTTRGYRDEDAGELVVGYQGKSSLADVASKLDSDEKQRLLNVSRCGPLGLTLVQWWDPLRNCSACCILYSNQIILPTSGCRQMDQEAKEREWDEMMERVRQKGAGH